MATQLFLVTSPGQVGVGAGLFIDPGAGGDSSFGTWISRQYNDDGFMDSFLAFAASRGGLATIAEHTNNYGGGTDKIVIRPVISDPVAAQVTISGSITFNIWGSELADTDDATLICRLMKLAPDGTKTLIVESSFGTELTTTNGAKNWSASPTSTTLNPGDRLYMLVGQTLRSGGSTMPSLSRATIRVNGPTGGANGDSYISLTETVTFDTSTPAGTKFFLRDSSADVPSVTGARDANRTQGSSAVTAVTATTAGPTSGVQLTTTSGGQVREWYTPRLGPVNIEGPIYVKLRGEQSSRDVGNACFRIELARVDADGSNAQVIVTDVVAQISNTPVKLPASGSEATRDIILKPQPISLAGHRLRIRVYLDESWGAYEGGSGVENAPMGSGQTGTLYYGGTAGASGDSYVQLSESPSDFVEPPNMNPYSYLVPYARV